MPVPATPGLGTSCLGPLLLLTAVGVCFLLLPSVNSAPLVYLHAPNTINTTSSLDPNDSSRLVNTTLSGDGGGDGTDGGFSDSYRAAKLWSDFVIGIAYFAIPLELAFFSFKLPSMTGYQKAVASLLVTFIMLCGIGHTLEARQASWRWIFANRLLTALVSAATAMAMPHVLHKIVQGVQEVVAGGRLVEKQRDMLADAQALTHLGNWEMETDPRTGCVTVIDASDEWFRIFGIDQRIHNAATSSSSPPPLKSSRVPFDRYLACVAADERNAIQDAVKDSLITGECFNFVQRIYRESDGRESHIRLFGKPLDGAAAHLRGRLRGTAQDITTQVHAERELVRAKEAALIEAKHKDIFLATMSHELRTPLTSIIGHVDLMAETDMDALQREYMHSAKRAASTLLSVINDILDYSKLMAGMVDMDPHVTHLNEVLTDIHAITRDLGKDVHLVVCNYDGPYLVLDAVRLRQILLNLVGNAVKFTEPGGLVHVTATYTLPTPNTATLTLAVRDTGIGIPPSVVPRLFQPFMQADASISRRFGGTGLGLSIVKKLVTAMGGTIRVDSVENMGATFTVTLTVPTAAPPLASQPAVVAAADLKILVAEDNPVTQKLLLRMLKPCDVTIADNGQIAVDLIRHSDPRAAPPYNIMLCDVNMPVMDGLTATRTIRTLPQGRDIYIIGLTANGFKKDRDDCLAAGMDAYLSKPFTKVGLLQLIHSAHRSASIGDDIDGVNPPPPPLPPLHPTTAPNNPSSQPQPQPPPPVTTTPRLPRVLDLSRIGKGVRASELVLCSTDTLVTSLSANGSGTAGMGFAAMHPHQHPPHNGIHHQHHQQQQQQQQ